MKAFITGGTGFIGSHIIDYYLQNKKDVEIFALVRDRSNLKWLEGYNLNFLEGDIFSIPSLPTDLDYVFHLAGLTLTSKLANYYTVNQHGTASLFQALDSQKIQPKRIVYLSSLAAAGPSIDCQPLKESSSPHPITPYGMSKLKGEEEALVYKDIFPTVIIRATVIFGPRDRDLLPFFKFIKKGLIPSMRLQERLLSLCYVKDLVRALDLVTQKDLRSGEIFNIADPKPYSWVEFGTTAGEAMGKSPRKLEIPLSFLPLIGMMSELISFITRKPALLNKHRIKDMKERCWIADVAKAQEKLSFSPDYSLREAIQETFDWYIQHEWL